MSMERFGVWKLSTSSSVTMPRMPHHQSTSWILNGILLLRPRLRKNDSTNTFSARDTKSSTSTMKMNSGFQLDRTRFSGENNRMPNERNTSSSDR